MFLGFSGEGRGVCGGGCRFVGESAIAHTPGHNCDYCPRGVHCLHATPRFPVLWQVYRRGGGGAGLEQAKLGRARFGTVKACQIMLRYLRSVAILVGVIASALGMEITAVPVQFAL